MARGQLGVHQDPQVLLCCFPAYQLTICTGTQGYPSAGEELDVFSGKTSLEGSYHLYLIFSELISLL